MDNGQTDQARTSSNPPAQEIAGLLQELKGKSLEWWRGKLRGYMRRAKAAEDNVVALDRQLSEARRDLGSATHNREEAEARVRDLEVTLADLTRQRDAEYARLRSEIVDLTDQRDVASAEAKQYRDEVAKLDIDAFFNDMAVSWEQEIANDEKEMGL